MRSIHSIFAVFAVSLIVACSTSGGGADPVRDHGAAGSQAGLSASATPHHGEHLQSIQSLAFDPETGTIEVVPDRITVTHLDLAWLWKHFPDMLDIEIVDYDPVEHEITLEITFTNPLNTSLRDIRAIFPLDGRITPNVFDGWSVRGGASVENPDPYFGFATTYPLRSLEPDESDTRVIEFSYIPPTEIPPFTPIRTSFVLDATVDANTAEPYEFGEPDLTGRFFSIAISDWQDDITGAFLHAGPCGWQFPLRLAPFGDEGKWGTSIPDIPEGDYLLRLTAESPETAGEIGEGNPAVAVEWLELSWPPVGPLVPMPSGQGIYGFGFIDPDTNLPPTDATEFMTRFKDDMGGTWLIIEYGEICNSGYLAMHEWTPVFVDWMNDAAPELPIHLMLDNLGFPPPGLDPCHHPVENYTQLFFDHLLASIRGQILDNPDFDNITGLHFDIEVFPSQYTQTELFAIYGRYADFLARLHLEPDLHGRNITLYDFDRHPHREPGDLEYLSTVDATLGACYYSRFKWEWTPSETETPFFELEKILGIHHARAVEHGRPYYPILGTFSGWLDRNLDTLGDITPCPGSEIVLIDDFCFGTGDFNTINEYDIVKAKDVHGMEVERVLLNLATGEPIFPSNGFAVYLLGDGDPDTPCDDSVYCRTAYAIARTQRIFRMSHNPLILGDITFRFENNSYWKAAAISMPLARGDITALSGHIRFSDGLDLQRHPELWGGITIELTDPLNSYILNHPAYRTSIDIVGVADGSYIFPDLPRAVLTIQAFADGWESDPVVIDMTENFAYRENVDLILHPV